MLQGCTASHEGFFVVAWVVASKVISSGTQGRTDMHRQHVTYETVYCHQDQVHTITCWMTTVHMEWGNYDTAELEAEWQQNHAANAEARAFRTAKIVNAIYMK